MSLKTNKNKHYKKRVEKIKKKLSCYSDESFLEKMFLHMKRAREPSNGIISNFPWCCFLALKWKFTVINKKYTSHLSESDFISIINSIYLLQDDAIDLSEDSNAILEMRRYMISQLQYQSPFKFDINTLSRQYGWFCCSESNYYKDCFYEVTGVKLEDFYIISAYLIIMCSDNCNADSKVIPYQHFIIHLHPFFGLDVLKGYLNFVSIKLNEIRAFMGAYKDEGELSVEYFRETPMLKKPIIITDDGLLILSKKILKSALSSMVPNVLKGNVDNYKNKFGNLMEVYIGNVIKEINGEVVFESEIKELYNKKNIEGKSVDFLLKYDKSTVFIESKAIEPDLVVKSTNASKSLKDRLKRSFIKGIIQGQECASHLSKTDLYENSESDSLLIITHRDHYIYNGVMVDELIDKKLFQHIENELGKVWIDKKRIFYITIDEFENLVYVSNFNNIAVTDIISGYANGEADTLTRKGSLNDYLYSIVDKGIPDCKFVTDSRSILSDVLVGYISKSNHLWSGRVNEYVYIRNSILE
ncbi:GapS1 family protein [Serratia fonticola]|uniref:GapS1 family protein n=1 Tax=Serratia fonticola TaxID=47917 RepID=UPI00093C9A72|nr:hypothetical protein [Serratia fonticola]OKP27555.1 hypothetical protein BSQ40_14470 [Serratia fonticola]